MPSAPRERKPALFALAILLVVLGAGAAGELVLRAGHRVAAVEITQPVNKGEPIPSGAMREVEISSDSGLEYVPWSQAAQVSRYFAANSIPQGTLLTRNMVAASGNVTTGKVTVGLSLKPGQLPSGTQVGDHVRAFAVTGSTECQANPGRVLSADAVVTQVSGSASQNGSSASVNIAVDPQSAPALVCTSSNGDVGVALLPDNG